MTTIFAAGVYAWLTWLVSFVSSHLNTTNDFLFSE